MWHDHEKWFQELRELLGPEADELSEEDIMFVSNLAVQTVHGEVGLHEAMHEINKWRARKMGFLGYMNEEAFELELSVNHPNLIDITMRLKENLRLADEPGIADALIQVRADPDFEMFQEEGSMVAVQGKAWFAIDRMTEAEHQTMGWCIAQALKERHADS